MRHELRDASGRTSAEVRQERAARRAGSARELPPTRGFDEIMAMLSELSSAEQLHQEQEELAAAEAAGENLSGMDEPDPPRPTPRPAPRAAPRPPPAEPDPDVDYDAPPSPPSRQPATVDRSPSAALRRSGGPGLDDLFGNTEGRVKIGKRTIPRTTADE